MRETNSYLNLCVILITASIICYLLKEIYVMIWEQEVTLVNWLFTSFGIFQNSYLVRILFDNL